MLKVGDIAPLHIKVLDQDGKPTSLYKLRGKYAVIYFYPKDSTPGCTQEACSFNDFGSELHKLDAHVFGVSADSPESHRKFRKNHKLTFPLWSDKKRELISAFGALKIRSMFGKKTFSTSRMTFALGKDGEVLKIWPRVSVRNHAQEVLAFFKSYVS